MNWCFDPAVLDDATKQVLPLLGRRFGFGVSGGIPLTWTHTDEPRLTACFDGAALAVTAPHRPAFLRAITLCLQHGGEPFSVSEEIRFDANGLMFDCSRNGVLTVERTKDFLMQMAMMGLTVYLPYMEDVYDIPGQADFGYLRGKYSADELREIDDFAFALGIEVIPCIQTLGHLNQYMVMGMGAALRDTGDVLLVGDERVNRLIDAMFATLSGCFRSRRIHIGMDEAYDLGRGKYLDLHGYVPPADIMKQHLDTVYALAQKHGLTCLMWDDMFFHPTGGVGDMAALKPDGVIPVYWDYTRTDAAQYEEQIDRRRCAGGDVWFAGTTWRSTGAVPHPTTTLVCSKPALAACLTKGVRNVFATAWGDNGNDCPADACLLGLALFASTGYGHDPYDDAPWRALLETVTGLPADVYLQIEQTDTFAQAVPEKVATPYRYALFSDPLCGKYDEHLRYLAQFDPTRFFGQQAQTFTALAAEYAGTYHEKGLAFYAALCRVLTLKWDLGFTLCDAFRAGDRDEVRQVLETLVKPLIPAVETLRTATLDKWRSDFKLNGQEVQDLRLGGLESRLRTAAQVIGEYLDGDADAERQLACLLEERHLLWRDPVPRVWGYPSIATAAKL